MSNALCTEQWTVHYDIIFSTHCAICPKKHLEHCTMYYMPHNALKCTEGHSVLQCTMNALRTGISGLLSVTGRAHWFSKAPMCVPAPPWNFIIFQHHHLQAGGNLVLNKMNELLSIAFYTIVAIQSNFSVLVHEPSASYGSFSPGRGKWAKSVWIWSHEGSNLYPKIAQ